MSNENSNQNEAGFSIETQYPFVNEIVSKDKSVNIAHNGLASSPIDLGVELIVDESLENIFDVVIDQESVISDDGNGTEISKPVNKIYLRLKEDIEPGIVYIDNNTMNILPSSEVPAVLVVNEDGEWEWLEVPLCERGDDYVLGTYDGYWHWYHVEECNN